MDFDSDDDNDAIAALAMMSGLQLALILDEGNKSSDEEEVDHRTLPRVRREFNHE